MVYQRIADLLAENLGALTEPVEDQLFAAC
jgi:hypothetical protein